MSNRIDLELDTALAEDCPDDPVGEWDENLLEDFPEDDPAALDGPIKAKAKAQPKKAREKKPASRHEAAKAASQPGQEAACPKPPRPPKKRRRSKGRHLGTGFYFSSLMLLASLVLAAGVLTAIGGVPEAMLDFSGLRDWTAIGDFSRHPINAFWLSALVVSMAAYLAGLGIQRRLGALQDQLKAQQNLLAAVGALDPDVPETWRQDIILADAELAAVTGNLLGHYHLQQARLTRYVGLEGELHRLEKALADGSLMDLQGEWDNPCAGSLADQALRLLASRDEQTAAAARQQEELASRGSELVRGLRESRRWLAKALDEISNQGTLLERFSRRLGKLAAGVPDDADERRRRERLSLALTALREELAALPARGSAVRTAAEPGALAGLVEKASRLAFQIAMEVARLGAKGERLLPLTQDLEELTTELRAQADRGKLQPGADDPRDRALETIRGRLSDLDPRALGTEADPEWAAALKELAPAASTSSADLTRLSQQFEAQTARLRQLCEQASALFGIEADDLPGERQPAVNDEMLVDRFDPFAPSNQPPGGLVADPFASNGGSIFEAEPSGQQEFARCILPGEETSLLNEPAPEPAPGFGPQFEQELTLDSAPPPQFGDLPCPPAAAAQPVQPGLSSSAEKVYDLSEFDAQRLPSDPEAESSSLKVYDLSEFDAVRIA